MSISDSCMEGEAAVTQMNQFTHTEIWKTLKWNEVLKKKSGQTLCIKWIHHKYKNIKLK